MEGPFSFIKRLDDDDKHHCFWILEEDYADVYEVRNKINIRHLKGKDREILVEVLKKYPKINLRLMPISESAITFVASDKKLPAIQFVFERVGAFVEYTQNDQCIWNPKTMKQLEKLCQKHDSEISIDLRRNRFVMSYYTEMLAFGDEPIDSSEDEIDTSQEISIESDSGEGEQSGSEESELEEKEESGEEEKGKGKKKKRKGIARRKRK